MKTNNIPLHKVSDMFGGHFAILRHLTPKDTIPNIDYPHRDEYFIIILLESGSCRFMVDFSEYSISGRSLKCLLPGHVHLPLEMKDPNAWILIIDETLVKKEYKEMLERVDFINSNPILSDNVLETLTDFLHLIEKRMHYTDNPVGKNILCDLVSSYIGVVCDIYSEGLPLLASDRHASITSRFRSLLKERLTTVKSPSQYAGLLNISPSYLNESLRKTTGMSTSRYINNEVVIQAKRLLFYTRLDIKEIAFRLGYEDHAYFSRIFTNSTGSSPSAFRKQYLK